MNERLSRALKNPWTTHTLVGAVCFGGGVAVGYFMSRRQTVILAPQPDDDEQLDFNFDTEGLADSRAIIDEETYDSPATVPETEVEERELIMAPPQDIPEGIHLVEPPDDVVTVMADNQPIRENIFQDPGSEWEYDEELKYREAHEEGPYPVHRDEFYGNEMEFLQVTYTYYAGDDIMCDEENEIVANHEKVIGDLRFGHGSGDRNVFYVRNLKRRMEYEVLHDPGRYQVEVMGLQTEEEAEAADLKHSHRPTRFRDRD